MRFVQSLLDSSGQRYVDSLQKYRVIESEAVVGGRRRSSLRIFSKAPQTPGVVSSYPEYEFSCPPVCFHESRRVSVAIPAKMRQQNSAWFVRPVRIARAFSLHL